MTLKATAPNAAANVTDSRRRFIQAMHSATDQQLVQERDKCLTQVEPLKLQQSKSNNSASPLSREEQPTLTIQGEAADRYLEVIRQILADERSCEITVTASERLIAFTHAEIRAHPEDVKMPQGNSELLNPASLLAGVDDVSLGKSYELPEELQTKKHKSFGMLMNFDPLIKTPTSLLPPEMQKFKYQLVVEATKLARAKVAMPTDSDPEKTKRHINETLEAHGEPDFPFDALVTTHDAASPTGTSIVIDKAGRMHLCDLEQRKPKLSEHMREMVGSYVDKALAAGVVFKDSLTAPPRADFQPPKVPRSTSVSEDSKQRLMSLYSRVSQSQEGLMSVPKEGSKQKRFFAMMDHIASASTATLTAPAQESQRLMLESQLAIHQLLKAPLESLTPELQQLKRHMFESVACVKESPYGTDPQHDKDFINRTLRSHGEPEFEFDDMTQYDALESPNGKAVQFGKKAMAQLQDLHDRKPRVYEFVWDLLQDYVNKGCFIEGYFKPARRGPAAHRSK